eukprot:COSAG02_NODE_668_length_18685_cov_185.638976_7_plen_62_part_00
MIESTEIQDMIQESAEGTGATVKWQTDAEDYSRSRVSCCARAGAPLRCRCVVGAPRWWAAA